MDNLIYGDIKFCDCDIAIFSFQPQLTYILHPFYSPMTSY